MQCAADLQEAQQAATQAAASAAAQSALTEAQAAQALEATEERHAAQQHASNAELQNVEQRAATELDELREHIQRLTADVAATQNSAAEAAAELALVAGCHVTDKAASDAEVAAMAARLHECQQQAAAAAEEHNTAAFALSDRLATAERQAAEYRSLLQTAQASTSLQSFCSEQRHPCCNQTSLTSTAFVSPLAVYDLGCIIILMCTHMQKGYAHGKWGMVDRRRLPLQSSGQRKLQWPTSNGWRKLARCALVAMAPTQSHPCATLHAQL